jgi:hypothetical protein
LLHLRSGTPPDTCVNIPKVVMYIYEHMYKSLQVIFNVQYKMEIRLRGEMTITDVRQALLEQLHELETKYAVKFFRGVTLYVNPTNGFGDDVLPACRTGMNSEPCTAQGHTAVQPMRESYDQTTSLRRPGGGAAAFGAGGGADAAACSARPSKMHKAAASCRSLSTP